MRFRRPSFSRSRQCHRLWVPTIPISICRLGQGRRGDKYRTTRRCLKPSRHPNQAPTHELYCTFLSCSLALLFTSELLIRVIVSTSYVEIFSLAYLRRQLEWGISFTYTTMVLIRAQVRPICVIANSTSKNSSVNTLNSTMRRGSTARGKTVS